MVNKYVRALTVSWVVVVLSIAQLMAVVPPVPVEITYQGHLEESGLSVNGVRSFLFTITDADGHARDILNGGIQLVSVSSGIFSYVLNVSTIDWEAQEYYLEVKMEPSTAHQGDGLVLMGPRTKINTHLYEKFIKDNSVPGGHYVYYTAPSVTSSKGVVANEAINATIAYKYVRRNNYWDILDTSQQWRAQAKDIVMQFVEETGVKEYFVDAGVQGSMATGVARRPGADEDDPSDVDFIIYLDLTDDQCEAIRDVTWDTSRAKYGSIMAEKLLPKGVKADIFLASAQRHRIDNPKFIYYSLSQNKMYGRDDGEKVYVAMYWFENDCYQVGRAEYSKYLVYYYDKGIREMESKGQKIIKEKIDKNKRLVVYNGITKEVLLVSH